MEWWIVAVTVTALLGLLFGCTVLPYLLAQPIPLISVEVEEGRLCKHCYVVDLPLIYQT